MRRADRLFLLTRLLNAARGRVVTGDSLAEALEVSLRTLYRDIDALRAGGLALEGERGVGYRLAERFALPAVGLTDDELDALVLGMRVVEKAGDPALALAAVSLNDKIAAALPPERQAEIEAARLYSPKPPQAPPPGDLSLLRRALRQRRRLAFHYVNAKGEAARREVEPVALSYLGTCWVLVAWCLWRRDYRVFRTDRMSGVALKEERFRPRGRGDAEATAPWA